MSLDISRRDTASSCVLVVRGAIDVTGCRRLGSSISEAFAGAPARMVIDLRAAEFIDSTGLAVLVRARRQALRRSVELKLVCDAPATLKVLELTGLARSFDVYATREAAL